MASIYSFLLLISAFFIQVTVLGKVRFFGIVPDIMLILIVYFSFFRDIKKTIFLAIFFGFLFDLFFSSIFGLHTLIFFIAAWLSSLLSKDRKSITLPRILFVIAALTFAESVFMTIGVYLDDVPLSVAILSYLLLQIGLNLGFGALIFRPVRSFFEMIDRLDRFSKQKVKV